MWTSLSLHVQMCQHHPLVISWLWSFTHDASKSELEGFISTCKPVTVSQTHQLKHEVGPSETAPCPAQPGDRAGALAGTSPCTQKHTQIQLDPGTPFLQVILQLPVWLMQMFFWLQPAWEMCHFMGWGSWGECRTSVPSPRAPRQAGAGHTGCRAWKGTRTLDCFGSKFLNPAQLFNKTLLWSTGNLPWWGICSLYIHTYV